MIISSRVKLVQSNSYPNPHKNFNDGTINKVAYLHSLLE
jgi:hypothetical protein